MSHVDRVERDWTCDGCGKLAVSRATLFTHDTPPLPDGWIKVCLEAETGGVQGAHVKAKAELCSGECVQDWLGKALVVHEAAGA